LSNVEYGALDFYTKVDPSVVTLHFVLKRVDLDNYCSIVRKKSILRIHLTMFSWKSLDAGYHFSGISGNVGEFSKDHGKGPKSEKSLKGQGVCVFCAVGEKIW